MVLTQLSFGTNKELRDEAYSYLHKAGFTLRRFTLRNQLFHGQLIGTVFYLDFENGPDTGEAEAAYDYAIELSRKAESSLPRPQHFGVYKL